MQPEHWKGQSHVLGAPQGWDASVYGPCVGLPVYIGEGEIISCWAPTWREKIRLLFGYPVDDHCFKRAAAGFAPCHASAADRKDYA